MSKTIAWNRAHDAEARRQRGQALRLRFFVRPLQAGQTLFKCGEPKECVYRVEDGAIRIVANATNAPEDVIEEVSPGMLFGLGNLDHHINTAIATLDSTVSFWPRSELPALIAQAPETEQRQFDAIEREFTYLRRTIVASTADRPVARVAALLSYLSQTNETEGRDPAIIDDPVQCHLVAEYLKMDIATLEDALRTLEREGIISFHPPRGIRISDLGRLDALTQGI
jgi:CRP/FNR family transcriptional regulator, anaerobic regulatory protein